MKVLIINGSPHRNGTTSAALAQVEQILQENGIESERYWVGSGPFQGCLGCLKCMGRKGCVIDDDVNRLLDRSEEFDGLIVGSPVHFAGLPGPLVSFLSRLLYASGGCFAGKVAAGVVVCRRGGATAAYQQLNMFFGVNNMVIATSQYWNLVHGANGKDVLQDHEGMQTMRTLARNIVWLLRATQESPLPPPTHEPKVRTNFVR